MPRCRSCLLRVSKQAEPADAAGLRSHAACDDRAGSRARTRCACDGARCLANDPGTHRAVVAAGSAAWSDHRRYRGDSRRVSAGERDRRRRSDHDRSRFHEPDGRAPPHDWLSIMGGAIGFGLPCSVGAAVAAPNRKVVTLEGDGSGMYTLQSLWTMARIARRHDARVRESLVSDPSRRACRCRCGHARCESDRHADDRSSGPRLGRPAKAQGVEAGRAATLEELEAHFKRGSRAAGLT